MVHGWGCDRVPGSESTVGMELASCGSRCGMGFWLSTATTCVAGGGFRLASLGRSAGLCCVILHTVAVAGQCPWCPGGTSPREHRRGRGWWARPRQLRGVSETGRKLLLMGVGSQACLCAWIPFPSHPATADWATLTAPGFLTLQRRGVGRLRTPPHVHVHVHVQSFPSVSAGAHLMTRLSPPLL